MKRFTHFQNIVQDYGLQQMDMINKDKSMPQYKPGAIVYFILCQSSLLKTSSTKFSIIYIGLLVVYTILNKFYYDGY